MLSILWNYIKINKKRKLKGIYTDFAMQRCDVLDITTNTRYEIQTANISEKLKKCSGNTVVIPIKNLSFNNLKDYILNFVLV